MNAPASTEPIAVGDYVDMWLDHTAGRVRGTTLHGYESIMRNHVKPAFEGRDLDSLTPLDLQNLYSRLLQKERPLSAGTVLNLHLCLTQAFGQAVRWGYLAANPAKGAQPPRPRRKEPTAVDAALCARIMDAAADTRFELVVAIALATGMRRGEILGLKWQDISADMTGAQVRRTLQSPKAGILVFEEPKTKRSRRQVALPEFLVPYLVKQRAKQGDARERLGDAWQENDAVVDWGDGSLFHPATLSSGWRNFCRENELPHVRFHDLRHAHATLMLLQGVHPKVVSERLGHASIGITLDTYSHVLPAMQEEAVKAFDSLFPSAT